MTDSVAATAEDYSHQREFLGHPVGLYVCFTTELWERFSFYGMKYLLLLYLTKYHLFTDEMGFDVLGSYAGLVYALPLIGGIIADRFLGMRKSVLFGGIMLALYARARTGEDQDRAIDGGHGVSLCGVQASQ